MPRRPRPAAVPPPTDRAPLAPAPRTPESTPHAAGRGAVLREPAPAPAQPTHTTARRAPRWFPYPDDRPPRRARGSPPRRPRLQPHSLPAGLPPPPAPAPLAAGTAPPPPPAPSPASAPRSVP